MKNVLTCFCIWLNLALLKGLPFITVSYGAILLIPIASTLLARLIGKVKPLLAIVVLIICNLTNFYIQTAHTNDWVLPLSLPMIFFYLAPLTTIPVLITAHILKIKKIDNFFYSFRYQKPYPFYLLYFGLFVMYLPLMAATITDYGRRFNSQTLDWMMITGSYVVTPISYLIIMLGFIWLIYSSAISLTHPSSGTGENKHL